MKTDVIYIKIRLKLDKAIDEADIKEFVNNLDYDISDDKRRIKNIEIEDFLGVV